MSTKEQNYCIQIIIIYGSSVMTKMNSAVLMKIDGKFNAEYLNKRLENRLGYPFYAAEEVTGLKLAYVV